MSKKAAAADYDTVQFLRHPDNVNYPCDPKDSLLYMNVEIVGVKMVGTYPCAIKSGNSPFRAGWGASRTCICDNRQRFTNCRGVPTLSVNFASKLSSKAQPEKTLLV